MLYFYSFDQPDGQLFITENFGYSFIILLENGPEVQVVLNTFTANSFKDYFILVH